MKPVARAKIALLAVVVAAFGLQAAERLAIPGVAGLITVAEARVGRPLTPVSVAGVARRSVRRCAVGVYYC
jgi:hypothetical protein